MLPDNRLELFLQQAASEQRRLLETVMEKASWKDCTLQTTLFEPFQILLHSNQESNRKEKENAGSGREFGMDTFRTLLKDRGPDLLPGISLRTQAAAERGGAYA
jgi:hypothetical protein